MVRSMLTGYYNQKSLHVQLAQLMVEVIDMKNVLEERGVKDMVITKSLMKNIVGLIREFLCSPYTRYYKTNAGKQIEVRHYVLTLLITFTSAIETFFFLFLKKLTHLRQAMLLRKKYHLPDYFISTKDGQGKLSDAISSSLSQERSSFRKKVSQYRKFSSTDPSPAIVIADIQPILPWCSSSRGLNKNCRPRNSPFPSYYVSVSVPRIYPRCCSLVLP